MSDEPKPTKPPSQMTANTNEIIGYLKYMNAELESFQTFYLIKDKNGWEQFDKIRASALYFLSNAQECILQLSGLILFQDHKPK